MTDDIQCLPLKQGDTFSYGGPVLLPAGNWSATSALRDRSGNVVAQVSVQLTPLVPPTLAQSHTIVLTIASDATAALEPQPHSCDVRFADDSIPAQVMHSPTFNVDVQEAIT